MKLSCKSSAFSIIRSSMFALALFVSALPASELITILESTDLSPTSTYDFTSGTIVVNDDDLPSTLARDSEVAVVQADVDQNEADTDTVINGVLSDLDLKLSIASFDNYFGNAVDADNDAVDGVWTWTHGMVFEGSNPFAVIDLDTDDTNLTVDGNPVLTDQTGYTQTALDAFFTDPATNSGFNKASFKDDLSLRTFNDGGAQSTIDDTTIDLGDHEGVGNETSFLLTDSNQKVTLTNYVEIDAPGLTYVDGNSILNAGLNDARYYTQTAADAAFQPLDADLTDLADGALGVAKVDFGTGTDGHVWTSDGAGGSAWEALSGGGDLVAANNLSDVANAATAFGNIKQAASTTSTGVLEIATAAEAAAGTETAMGVSPYNAFFSGSRVVRHDMSTGWSTGGTGGTIWGRNLYYLDFETSTTANTTNIIGTGGNYLPSILNRRQLNFSNAALSFRIHLGAGGSANGIFRAHWGKGSTLSAAALSQSGFGIECRDGDLWGVTYDGSLNELDLSSSVTTSVPKDVAVILKSGTAEFFVNGVSAGTLDAPTGTSSNDQNWLQISIENGVDTTNNRVRLHNLRTLN